MKKKQVSQSIDFRQMNIDSLYSDKLNEFDHIDDTINKLQNEISIIQKSIEKIDTDAAYSTLSTNQMLHLFQEKEKIENLQKQIEDLQKDPVTKFYSDTSNILFP